MKGRTEHELKTNKKIENLISDYPDYLSDFNISMEAEEKTHTTRLNYMYAVVSYLNYLRDQGKDIFDMNMFKDITTTDIKKYFVKIRYKDEGDERVEKSGSYINLQQRALGEFFRFLRESRIITENPYLIDATPIKIGKKHDQSTTVAMDKEETDIFYGNIRNGVGNSIARKKQENWRERDLALLDLALNTGLRVSALTEINVDDVDFETKTIKVVEKGNRAFTIKFDDKSSTLLKRWIDKRERMLLEKGKEQDALFISNRLNRISQDAVRDLVHKYSTGIDKHITTHKLRSTFATSVIAETNNVHAVQTALGHSGSVTDRYLGNKMDERELASYAARKHYEGR